MTSASHARPRLGEEPTEPLPFQDIYRENFAFVRRSALRLGATEAWVDDIAQEVFVIAARRLDTFEFRASIRTWLFAITQRVLSSHRRWHRRHVRKVDALQRVRELFTVASRSSDSSRAEAQSTLVSLLAQLPENLRAIYILSELEGMSCAEIAEGLNQNPNTTYSRLRKARTLMLAQVEATKARPS